ncbi:SDR family oxidoreductase [Nocardia wallacei]|uniref:SDR family oxidoreductase n=1 Tax=Nocardia wallacei TaxID=480035 RepID=UPI002456EFAE|nr:SDR family oxidoreductase [Nocardia wallacei]
MTIPPARSALITGGSRGIGAEIARRLAREGYKLTLAARTADLLHQTAQQLQAETGTDITAAPVDLNDPDQIQTLIDTHDNRYGRLDLLVSNAGTGTVGPLADMPAKTYNRMLDINLRAPIALIQYALPLLRKTARHNPDRGARIIAIASIAGVAAEAGLAAYGASKAALISLCESITLEESPDRVSATAISPGYVDTDMTRWQRHRINPSEMITPADIAELALAVSRLSPNAAIPNIVISRTGSQIWRA